MLLGLVVGATAGYLLGRGATVQFKRNPYSWGRVKRKGRR